MNDLKDRLVNGKMIKYSLEFDPETRVLKSYRFENELVGAFDEASADRTKPDLDRLVSSTFCNILL